MKWVFAISAAFLVPPALLAQGLFDGLGPPDRITIISLGMTAGQYFMAIFTGVVLAYAFQLLLTNLSVASGISALEGMIDPGKRKARPRMGNAENPDWDETAVKVEAGIGIWAMITSAIALFLACLLAIELIRIQSRTQAVVLSLVIWSVFMGTMMYLEGAAASSLLGYIAGAVRNGVSNLFSPLKAAAGKLAESRAQSAQKGRTLETAEEIAATVRRELFGEKETEPKPESPGIMDRIRNFVQSGIKPKAMDAVEMGHQVQAVLTDPELLASAKRGELQNLDRARFAEIVAGRTDLDKGQAERLAASLHYAWGKFILENAPAAAENVPTAQAAPALASAGSSATQSGSMADRYRRFKEFLRSTRRGELQPDRLEAEVKTLVTDPKEGLSQVRERAKELDRESLVQILSHREDMTPEEAGRIADQIDLARGRALSAKEQAEHREQDAMDRAMSRLRDKVYSLDRPELDFEGFQGDFRPLFEDPDADYMSLRVRLRGVDRDGVIALLDSMQGGSRSEAEQMVEKGDAMEKGEPAQAAAGVERMADRVMEAKERVLEQTRQVEQETRRRMENAKRISMEQAEAARKVTATAAWWLLATALVSAAAAMLGGIAAIRS
ncbi:MAG: hypothetical protein JWO30_2041 [Fibrobacteres bacterium]|nr:hypothetical protein [Fibrobacterota bacterium]